MISQIWEPLHHKGISEEMCVAQKRSGRGDDEHGWLERAGASLHCRHSPVSLTLLRKREADIMVSSMASSSQFCAYVTINGGRDTYITMFRKDYQIVLCVRKQICHSFVFVVEIGGTKVSGIVSGTLTILQSKC